MKHTFLRSRFPCSGCPHSWKQACYTLAQVQNCILIGLVQYCFNQPVPSSGSSFDPHYMQPDGLKKGAPLRLRPLHAAQRHHADIQQRPKEWSVHARENSIDNHNARVATPHCRYRLLEDGVAGAVRPVVEYVPEIVDVRAW